MDGINMMRDEVIAGCLLWRLRWRHLEVPHSFLEHLQLIKLVRKCTEDILHWTSLLQHAILEWINHIPESESSDTGLYAELASQIRVKISSMNLPQS